MNETKMQKMVRLKYVYGPEAGKKEEDSFRF
jgi:hypothetical protein